MRMALRDLILRFRSGGAAQCRAVVAASAARGQNPEACAVARGLGAVRSEGRAALACASARARAAHGCLLRGQRKAGAAATRAGVRMRRAHDRTFSSLFYLAYGESAPPTPTPREVVEFILMMRERVTEVQDIWKMINKLIDRFHDLDPVTQAMVVSIFFIPLFERIDRLVPVAEECHCPFVGVHELPFDVYPVREGLLEVLSLASRCTGHILMFFGCLVIAGAIDISKIPSKIIEYCTKDTEAAEAELGAVYLDFVKDYQATLFDPLAAGNKESKAAGAYLATVDKKFVMVLKATLFDLILAAGNKESKAAGADLATIDKKFVMVIQATLFDLILAANYLDIKDLLDLTCQTVTDMIKGKSPEVIRKTFNIKNDFTP